MGWPEFEIMIEQGPDDAAMANHEQIFAVQVGASLFYHSVRPGNEIRPGFSTGRSACSGAPAGISIAVLGNDIGYEPTGPVADRNLP
jgi:hypothetical protein